MKACRPHQVWLTSVSGWLTWLTATIKIDNPTVPWYISNMPKPDNVGVGTAILVISSWDREILLLQRQGAHAQGTFACPGGWIDFEDEDPKLAAVRELKEELGLKVVPEDLELCTVVSEKHDDLGVRTVTIYYKLYHENALHGVPKIGEPNKCSALRWKYALDFMKAEDKGELKLFPKLRGVLSELIKEKDLR